VTSGAGKIPEVTSPPPRPGSRSRTLVPLLVAVLGLALGAGGLALLHPFAAGRTPAKVTGAAATRHGGLESPHPLSTEAIYARIEPSVVDVTSTLRYDNETASGTGFVIDSRAALVITNNHVIRDATSVTVTIPSTSMTYDAHIIGVDVTADVAVLQISAPGLAAAPIGDSATAGTGTSVISFGNQAGAGGSPAISSGVINGTGRTIQASDSASGFTETLRNMLQTTARIEPGDSGGPLADAAGAVIGVDTAAGTGAAATGYAVPINTAMSAERQIRAGSPASGIVLGVAGFLGVVLPAGSANSVSAQEKREHIRGTDGVGSPPPPGCAPTKAEVVVPSAVAPVRSGALVVGVLCGTTAAGAGLVAGDVITAANGQPVSSPAALTGVVSGSPPGTLISVTWVTPAGKHRRADIRLDTAPAE
jgi:S1-C subfamily serine protease